MIKIRRSTPPPCRRSTSPPPRLPDLLNPTLPKSAPIKLSIQNRRRLLHIFRRPTSWVTAVEFIFRLGKDVSGRAEKRNLEGSFEVHFEFQIRPESAVPSNPNEGVDEVTDGLSFSRESS